jgi:hypothetical protein
MITIHERVERKRLNGYRKPGELYLVGSLPKYQCCNIPFQLSVDLVPKAGLQPLVNNIYQFECTTEKNEIAKFCPIACSEKCAGMFWISEQHYRSAAFFFSEARTMPIQIRIKRLHCGVKIGSWVMLAHRKSIVDYSNGANGWVDNNGEAHTDITYLPGVFTTMRVEAIEYVMECPYSEMKPGDRNHIDQLAAAGVDIISVIRDEDLEKGEYPEDKLQGYE